MRECEVCFEMHPEAEFFGLRCGHRFCQGCLADHLTANVRDGNVIEISCMMLGCEETFSKEDISRFGSKEIYQKYLQFKLNIDVEVNPRLKWCPRPGCPHYVEKKGFAQRTATCECGQRVCLKCGGVDHPGTKCGQLDKEFIGWTKSAHAKRCPSCRMTSQKIDGCNHMTCAKCRYQYCWICLQRWREQRHWRQDSKDFFKCPGKMYGDADVDTVLAAFERQQKRVCCTAFAGWLRAGSWPVRLCREKSCWFLLLFPILLPCTVLIMILGILLVLPFESCVRKCQGRRLINRIKVASGRRVEKPVCCGRCCFP